MDFLTSKIKPMYFKYLNLYSSGCGRSQCNLVCYADYRTTGCDLCNNENGTMYEGNICGKM